MPKPVVWNDDPACGHDVDNPYQTHYCTYIRVPRLLTLQNVPATNPAKLLLITAFQWYELWFKVLLVDLRTGLADDGSTYEPVKFLRRGIELFHLFDIHADLAETVMLSDLRLTQPVSAAAPLAASAQFNDLTALVRQLAARERKRGGGLVLAEAAREYRAAFKHFRARFQKFLRATLNYQPEAPTYAEWLRLPELFALQNGVRAAWTPVGQKPAAVMEPPSINPDENMFVIVHQCFELWFKVMLDHIDRSLGALQNGNVSQALHLIRRILRVQRMLGPQIQIPATMLPLDFLRFREQKQAENGAAYFTSLSPASGTESYQFREIEIVCGLRDDAVFRTYLTGTDKLPIRLLTPRQAERLNQPTLFEAFQGVVRARGLTSLDDLFTPADVHNPNDDLAQLADAFIDFDDFFRFWRLGHVAMVQKMIGTKSGTGFLGPEYLMETAGLQIQEKNRIFTDRQTRPRFFEELWAVRTRLRVG
jgi:tryptophan 2,3-dioxygenase